ncbi:MAG: carboxypeptidase-like regulatory domain-containing protein [Acidimicrobiales bacterium]
MATSTMQVELHPAEQAVSAGQPVAVRVDVLNTSPVIDAYRVRVLGLDPAWVQTDPGSLSLFPGATGSITAVINLPERFAAGSHRLSVQVYSERDEGEYELAELRLHVAEVERLDARLEPPVLTVSRRARFGLVLANNGNAEVAVRPEAVDAEDALTVSFDPALALVGPGQQTVISVTAKGRRPWFGTPVARQLAVTVAGNSATQEVQGTLLQRPRFSRGLMALMGLLVAATVFGMVLSSVFDDVIDAAKVDQELLKAAVDDGGGEADAVAAAPTALSGRVTVVGTGTGVSGVTVELYAADDDQVPKATAATDDAGNYAFNNIPVGTYRLRFVAAGFVETWFPDALGFDTAEEVEVELGATVAGLDVGLGGQPGIIGGKVVAPDPTGADVRLVLPAEQIGGSQDAEVAATKALPDGSFVFEDVPAPAEYRLEVTLAGFARQSRAVTIDAAEERKDIEIMLRKGDGSIEGSIVGPNGPLGGVTVTATDGSATFSTTSLTTEPVGSFVLRELVTPGTYTLNIDREGLRSEVLTLRLSEGQRLTGVTVTMTGAPAPSAARSAKRAAARSAVSR